MALTYPEQMAKWESLITGHHSRMAIRLMKLDSEKECHRQAARGWREATDLADTLLSELRAWREEAAGHEASRALLQERFEEQAQYLREVTSRLFGLEDHARRMKRYIEEKAACPHCRRFDECEDGCEFFDGRCGEDMPRYQGDVLEAREALGGFSL